MMSVWPGGSQNVPGSGAGQQREDSSAKEVALSHSVLSLARGKTVDVS